MTLRSRWLVVPAVVATLVACGTSGEPRSEMPTTTAGRTVQGTAIATLALPVSVESDGPIRSGRTVTVSGTRFPPNVPIAVTMCSIDPNVSSTITPASCDHDVAVVDTSSDAAGSFSTRYRPSRFIRSGGTEVDCSEPSTHCAIVAAKVGPENVDLVNTGGRSVVVGGTDAPTVDVAFAPGTARIDLTGLVDGKRIDVRQCAHLDEYTYQGCADTNVVSTAVASGTKATVNLPFRATIGTPGAATRCTDTAPARAPDQASHDDGQLTDALCFLDVTYDGNHFQTPITGADLASAVGGVAPAPPRAQIHDGWQGIDLDGSHALLTMTLDLGFDPGTVGVAAMCDDPNHVAPTRCSDPVRVQADPSGRLDLDLVLDRHPPSHASYGANCEKGCWMVWETQRARFGRQLKPPATTDTAALATTDGDVVTLSTGRLPRNTTATVRVCDPQCGGAPIGAATDARGRLQLSNAHLADCTSSKSCELEVSFDRVHQLGSPLHLTVEG
ncbi:MAG: hypothetical protein U0Q22_15090 [Acidimicrobiales bacterium]